MQKSDFSVSIKVKAAPETVFEKINRVKAWWTENLAGSSTALNDEFEVRFGDVHYSKQKLVEFDPPRRIVWLITEGRLNFTADPAEWEGTRICFDIHPAGDQTEIVFTHEGLVPEVECYEACSGAWTGYIKNSLFDYLSTGQGEPEPLEQR